ncbi:MAG: hypothetical protein L6R40_004161 [Gallowayella cf. fulva]|nr:MAG: hypothetical protein L6R40_004161 [Xanthomendoza cf. fulva]
MVFKPFTHLARQSLGKTFTHGYAQSVVAATQSSYASSTTPFGPFSSHHAPSRFSKHGTSQIHTTFQHSSTTSGLASNGQHGSTSDASVADGGLAAYYEAWQKQQRNNGKVKEWKQFQFPLRIGWQAPSVALDGKKIDKNNARLRPDTVLERGGLDRAYSASAVDDIKKAEDVAAEVTAIAAVDEAIATEISSLQIDSLTSTGPTILNVTSSDTAFNEETAASTVSNPSSSSVESRDTTRSSQLSSPQSDDTARTLDSVQSENIVKLCNDERYVEIPAAFEALLAGGVKPSVEAYNALLTAAIVLPAVRHQVVPKALGVYTSMLRERVLPDAAFLTSLLGLLSRRAIDVYQSKTVLDVKRLRFGNLKADSRFFFRSDEGEYAILSEDDALSVAIKIFDAAVSTSGDRLLSSEAYQLLIKACALNGQVEAMIRIYSHLEKHNVTPTASMFPAMIEAFARPGDLRTAVECYNAYKDMAIQNDAGHAILINRQDNEVYAAVVKSYASCGKHDGGERFFTKVVDSLNSANDQGKERLQEAQDVIVTHGLVQQRLDAGQFMKALRIVEERSMTPVAHSKAMARICSAAADHNDAESATEAYRSVQAESSEKLTAALSMLALHLRNGQIERGRTFWSLLYGSSHFDVSLIEPTTMYATTLIAHGHVDEGTAQARIAFARMRAAAETSSIRDQIKEKIDEAIEIIGSSLAAQQTLPLAKASMNLLWAMIENNGPVSPVSEQLLAGLGPREIASFSHQDVVLLLRTEAEMISGGVFLQDVAHIARFEHLLDRVLQSSPPLDTMTVELVERTMKSIEAQHPEVVMKWRQACQMVEQRSNASMIDSPVAPIATDAIPPAYLDTFDPYAATFDHRGSNAILDELDNPRSKSAANLDGALSRVRNMRRVGRHPRYIVYAKLITAAAKEGRVNLIFDLLGMARQDVAFIPQYSSVRDGWSSILDSMIGACLTVGNRNAAADFHQQILQMGSAPTANTYGLYITTLKESTRTFDEAREAVDIFQRAKSEGVEPSAFLYNALIGKLGKARRIDDCLWYFSEMRAHGIRPTSVTYGTIVNALCRVSNERHAEELFDEMESMPNYKPRPAPYNSLMQFFLTTKRDSNKVLEYYSRMLRNNIQPTMHTYKLLIDTYATLEPVDMAAAEGIMSAMRASGLRPEAVHYAALVHAKGCALHDMVGARESFDSAMANPEVRPQACLYQALFESMVANHCVEDTEGLLEHMASKGVEMTPYITNTLIHGWAMARNVAKAQALYEGIGKEKREPSTYEAMTRAFLAGQERDHALEVLQEMLSRGYPSAVTNKVVDLIGHAVS